MKIVTPHDDDEISSLFKTDRNICLLYTSDAADE